MQQLTASNPFQKALVFFVLIGSLVGLVPGVAGANSGTVVDEGLDHELNWVSIVDVAITRGDGTRNCTGVLVSSTLVLTAAHCVSPYRVFQDGSVVHRGLPNSITIQTSPVTLRRNTGTFGEPQPEGQTRRARAWSIHPTYKFHNTYDPDNDLGAPCPATATPGDRS